MRETSSVIKALHDDDEFKCMLPFSFRLHNFIKGSAFLLELNF